MITSEKKNARAEAEAFVEKLVAAGGLQEGPRWLCEQRAQAHDRYLALGLPTRRLEAWRRTDLRALRSTSFAAPDGAAIPVSLSRPAVASDALTLCFVDGRLSPELSQLDELPEGLAVRRLEEATSEIEGRLGTLAEFESRAFVAMNTALWREGLYLHVERGAQIERPVHILHVLGEATEPLAVLPRHLVVLEEGSRATLVEHYASQAGQVALRNAVSEVFVGRGASLEHLRLQEEGPGVFHLGSLDIHLEADSRVVSHSIALGGELARAEIRSVLAGKGAECTLTGLYLCGEEREIDHWTSIDHASSHTRSEQLYKGVLADRARAVFRGHILVREDSQKISAEQSDRNLLLSPRAHVDAMPQLEIYADDVRCTHGATIGQLDADALFYLRSRGLSAEEAKNMLTFAFGGEVVERIGNDDFRGYVEAALSRWLADHRIEEVA